MPFHAGWRFCAHCGFDSTGDDIRPAKAYCDHEFVVQGSHCVRCGYDSQPLWGLERSQLTWLAVGLSVAGFLLLAFSLTVYAVGPNAKWSSSPAAGRVAVYTLLGGLALVSFAVKAFLGTKSYSGE